jgi:hypothetical protein
MQLLELVSVRHRSGPSAGDDCGSDPAMNALRQRAESQWSQVDSRIERILSGDSRTFLSATRQQGGQ